MGGGPYNTTHVRPAPGRRALGDVHRPRWPLGSGLFERWREPRRPLTSRSSSPSTAPAGPADEAAAGPARTHSVRRVRVTATRRPPQLALSKLTMRIRWFCPWVSMKVVQSPPLQELMVLLALQRSSDGQNSGRSGARTRARTSDVCGDVSSRVAALLACLPRGTSTTRPHLWPLHISHGIGVMVSLTSCEHQSM
jgi:hypothetical protein